MENNDDLEFIDINDEIVDINYSNERQRAQKKLLRERIAGFLAFTAIGIGVVVATSSDENTNTSQETSINTTFDELGNVLSNVPNLSDIKDDNVESLVHVYLKENKDYVTNEWSPEGLVCVNNSDINTNDTEYTRYKYLGDYQDVNVPFKAYLELKKINNGYREGFVSTENYILSENEPVTTDDNIKYVCIGTNPNYVEENQNVEGRGSK